ncbi:hypothetical protein FACS189421_04130 [Bacteroidia bacterium]|nr:hypothetical protein FACS189421_04130 [Bacteroidia bacterium]GHT48103.1 hypothetical protein FACS189440_10830 [Bacteroidia bacterium]
MNLPLVSILIPLYNAQNYIEATIQNCLGQTYKNIEIIIVDDGSTDDSYQIAEKYLSDGVFLYRNPKKGACAARNYAFEKSHGDYVQFLDADDFCSLDKIEKQVEQLVSEKDNTLSFCNLRLMRDGKIGKYQKRVIDQDYLQPIELLIDMWTSDNHNTPHCYLVHRDLFLSTAGWDESIQKNQDGEFFSRVIAHAGKVLFTPDIYAVWRLTHSGISSTNTIETQKSQLRVIDKIAQIILHYENTERTRYACARQLGWFAYLLYPDNKSLFPQINTMLDKWKTKLVIPANGRLFKFLKIFVGWKLAAIIVKNPRVIQFFSLIDKRK